MRRITIEILGVKGLTNMVEQNLVICQGAKKLFDLIYWGLVTLGFNIVIIFFFTPVTVAYFLCGSVTVL